ncbi:MAG TPA: cell division protein FtsQ [Stellaceae bacterium]|jgi:alginate O-acetyltransferase complex protein AlgJ|nr:cell division protein FtsQ [Stellaceae bacterium]
MRLRFRPSRLPAFVLAAVLLAGLGSNIAAMLWRSEPVAHYSWHDIAAGKPTGDLAQFLLHKNPFADALVTFDRVVAWNAVGDLGTRVRRGCGNWLFLTDELEVHPNRDASLARHLKIIGQAAEFLRARNIALVVAAVPDKSRVEASHLCGADRSAALAPRYGEFVSQLRASGVTVADLLQPIAALDGERYYRTDTHWNERGAKAAADSIAAGLTGRGLAPSQQAQYRVTPGPEQERVGDLIRLAGLDGVPYPLRPKGDMVASNRIDASAKAGTGILDETPAPQLVEIGTSFSRRANFTEYLGMALGAPVDNRAKDGGGLTSAAISYFADPAFTKTPPHVIVWEVPERVLQQPVAAADEAWAAGLGGDRSK